MFVAHSEEPLACSNLRYSMASISRIVVTPIRIASWGHLDGMYLHEDTTNMEYLLFKSGNDAAYKRLPLELDHSPLRPNSSMLTRRRAAVWL